MREVNVISDCLLSWTLSSDSKWDYECKREETRDGLLGAGAERRRCKVHVGFGASVQPAERRRGTGNGDEDENGRVGEWSEGD